MHHSVAICCRSGLRGNGYWASACSAFVLLLSLKLLWLIKARRAFLFVIGRNWLHLGGKCCESIASCFHGAPEYVKVPLWSDETQRMHIADDQKLGRFNVSLPLCCLNNAPLLPTYTNARRRKQWRHHCNTLLDGQFWWRETLMAFLIPKPEHKREMFAMQIECMHSAKAHIRIYTLLLPLECFYLVAR